MKLKNHWKVIYLILPVLLVLGGVVIAFDAAVAGPGSEPSGRAGVDAFKDDDRDDDDDKDDSSGHGSGRDDDDRSGRRGGDDDDDHDDDDGDGVFARPEIDPAELGDVVVEIIVEEFVPAEVTIEAGQRITFINLDDDEHTATGIGFDTGELEPGDWATVTLENPGDAPYVCQFHSDMLGNVTVRGDASASPVAASPVASPSALGTPVTTDAAAQPVTIEIEDFAFATPQIEIPAGTTVTWVNNGVAPHTVTGSFGDSGVLQTGDSFSFTFGAAGTFDYVCQFHPQMIGQVVVT